MVIKQLLHTHSLRRSVRRLRALRGIALIAVWLTFLHTHGQSARLRRQALRPASASQSARMAPACHARARASPLCTFGRLLALRFLLNV